MQIRNILFGFIIFGLSGSAIAVPITGTINFSGGVTTNTSNPLTASQFTFTNPITVTSASGAFAPLAGGGVTYNPLNLNNLPQLLWSQTLNGLTYSFDLASIISDIVTTIPFSNIGFRTIAGAGTLNILGIGSQSTATAGAWGFTTQTGGTTTFSFSAAAQPVPEPMPLALVALGLIGMSLFGRTKKSAPSC